VTCPLADAGVQLLRSTPTLALASEHATQILGKLLSGKPFITNVLAHDIDFSRALAQGGGLCQSPLMIRCCIPLCVTLALCLRAEVVDVQVRVLAVDSENRTFTLLLPTGKELSPVKASPGDIAIGYTNQEIEGRLNTDSSPPRIDTIWPANPIQENAMIGVNRSMIRKAAGLGRGPSLARGDYLPDFAFYNQRGEMVYSTNLRRMPTVLTFLFTRCGDPNMCPATAARLAELGTRLAEAGRDDVRLVALSFDPEYDTPGILNQYGNAMGMDTPQFELLTGDDEAIQALLRLVGVRTIDENGTIVHNLVTLLSDDHGRIVLRQDGSRWSADSIFEKLETMQQ